MDEIAATSDEGEELAEMQVLRSEPEENWIIRKDDGPNEEPESEQISLTFLCLITTGQLQRRLPNFAKDKWMAPREFKEFTIIFKVNNTNTKIYLQVQNRNSVCTNELHILRISNSDSDEMNQEHWKSVKETEALAKDLNISGLEKLNEIEQLIEEAEISPILNCNRCCRPILRTLGYFLMHVESCMKNKKGDGFDAQDWRECIPCRRLYIDDASAWRQHVRKH